MATHTNIPNPYSDVPVRQRSALQVHVTHEVHQYLRGITANTPGAVCAICATLVNILVKEAKARKIKPQFEPENESRLIELLADLTFKRRKATAGSASA